MFLKFFSGQRDKRASANTEESTSEMSERKSRSQAESDGGQVQNDVVPTQRTLVPVVNALERRCKQIDNQDQHNRDQAESVSQDNRF